jgi:hypothetical protein
MVNSLGQLYTIEGFAAALIMLFTVWIVVGTTSVYTPGDTHISDMQLEQLGTDVLSMMDTPDNATASGKSSMQAFIENKDGNGPALFNNMFLSYCNNRTDQSTDNLEYSAWIYYRKANETKSYEFSNSRLLTRGDHPVRVTHWVQVDNRAPSTMPIDVETRVQVVLLEVLVWKG